MIPLRDTAPRYSAPFITVGLIAVNCLVFIYQVTLDPYTLEHFIYHNGVVPLRFAGFIAGNLPAEAAVPSLVTSMFLHGGLLHLVGNMWFLWIFGDNLEDQLGHFRYLLFYLACGLAGGFAHIFLNVRSIVPSVGASGAIAGVMGGYLLLFPGARVLTLVPFFLIFAVEIPAVVILLYWFVIQIFSGFASLAATTAQTEGGIAWFAHIGGFLAGIVLVKMMGRRPRVRRYYEW